MSNYAKHAAIWGWGEPSRSGEIEFYSKLAKKYGNKVLSLMCATGEIAYGLANNELRVTAVDIEPEMIAEAKKSNPDNINPLFLVGDVTNFDLLEKEYDFVFIGTGDFHHLISEHEMLKALSCIHQHLSDKRCLTLELFYPGNVSWQSPKRRFELSNPSKTGVKAWKLSETSYDSNIMREHIRQEVFVEQQGKVESFIHEFDLQLLTRENLIKLMEKTGFKIITEYSGFDFSLWHARSEKCIFEAIKS
jgi:ubiquinone/menaquinone biosynthesis C-methylase UbiE